MFILSLFVNLFGAGLSNVKDVLFLGFFTTLVFLLVLKRSVFLPRLEKYKKLILTLLVGGMVGGFLCGVLLYVVYTQTHNLPFNSYILTYNNNDFSSTQLVHNHVPKLVFATLGTYFGLTIPSAIDAGSAYMGLLPGFYAVILALIFILLILAAYGYYASLSKKTLLFTFLYSVIVFGLLKNIFDGGLFNYETMPLLFGFLYVVRQDVSFGLKKILFAFGILEILTLAIVFSSSDSVWLFYLKNHALVFAFVGLMVLFHMVFSRSETWVSKIIIGIFFVALLSGLAYIKSIEYIEYGFTRLERDNIVVAYHDIPDAQKLYQIGQIHIYSIENNKKDLTLYEFAQQLGLNYKHTPISSLWATCIPTTPKFEKDFILKLPNQLVPENVSNELFTFTFLPHSDLPQEYSFNAKLSPCLPSYIDVITQRLAEQGNQTFWLTQMHDTLE